MRFERNKVRELLRIDAVIFAFARVDEMNIEGMDQNEGQACGLTGIGQPIPAEHAFTAHRQVMLVRLNELEEEVEVVVFDVGVDQLFTLTVHDADVHLASMQVDSAVELRGGSIILHTLTQ